MADSKPVSFLESRKDWLEVKIIDTPDGGWDVWLRIDGTYYIPDNGVRDAMAAYFRQALIDELTK